MTTAVAPGQGKHRHGCVRFYWSVERLSWSRRPSKKACRRKLLSPFPLLFPFPGDSEKESVPKGNPTMAQQFPCHQATDPCDPGQHTLSPSSASGSEAVASRAEDQECQVDTRIDTSLPSDAGEIKEHVASTPPRDPSPAKSERGVAAVAVASKPVPGDTRNQPVFPSPNGTAFKYGDDDPPPHLLACARPSTTAPWEGPSASLSVGEQSPHQQPLLRSSPAHSAGGTELPAEEHEQDTPAASRLQRFEGYGMEAVHPEHATSLGEASPAPTYGVESSVVAGGGGGGGGNEDGNYPLTVLPVTPHPAGVIPERVKREDDLKQLPAYDSIHGERRERFTWSEDWRGVPSSHAGPHSTTESFFTTGTSSGGRGAVQLHEPWESLGSLPSNKRVSSPSKPQGSAVASAKKEQGPEGENPAPASTRALPGDKDQSGPSDNNAHHLANSRHDGDASNSCSSRRQSSSLLFFPPPPRSDQFVVSSPPSFDPAFSNQLGVKLAGLREGRNLASGLSSDPTEPHPSVQGKARSGLAENSHGTASQQDLGRVGQPPQLGSEAMPWQSDIKFPFAASVIGRPASLECTSASSSPDQSGFGRDRRRRRRGHLPSLGAGGVHEQNPLQSREDSSVTLEHQIASGVGPEGVMPGGELFRRKDDRGFMQSFHGEKGGGPRGRGAGRRSRGHAGRGHRCGHYAHRGGRPPPIHFLESQRTSNGRPRTHGRHSNVCFRRGGGGQQQASPDYVLQSHGQSPRVRDGFAHRSDAESIVLGGAGPSLRVERSSGEGEAGKMHMLMPRSEGGQASSRPQNYPGGQMVRADLGGGGGRVITSGLPVSGGAPSRQAFVGMDGVGDRLVRPGSAGGQDDVLHRTALLIAQQDRALNMRGPEQVRLRHHSPPALPSFDHHLGSRYDRNTSQRTRAPNLDSMALCTVQSRSTAKGNLGTSSPAQASGSSTPRSMAQQSTERWPFLPRNVDSSQRFPHQADVALTGSAGTAAANLLSSGQGEQSGFSQVIGNALAGIVSLELRKLIEAVNAQQRRGSPSAIPSAALRNSWGCPGPDASLQAGASSLRPVQTGGGSMSQSLGAQSPRLITSGSDHLLSCATGGGSRSLSFARALSSGSLSTKTGALGPSVSTSGVYSRPAIALTDVLAPSCLADVPENAQVRAVPPPPSRGESVMSICTSAQSDLLPGRRTSKVGFAVGEAASSLLGGAARSPSVCHSSFSARPSMGGQLSHSDFTSSFSTSVSISSFSSSAQPWEGLPAGSPFGGLAQTICEPPDTNSGDNSRHRKVLQRNASSSGGPSAGMEAIRAVCGQKTGSLFFTRENGTEPRLRGAGIIDGEGNHNNSGLPQLPVVGLLRRSGGDSETAAASGSGIERDLKALLHQRMAANRAAAPQHGGGAVIGRGPDRNGARAGSARGGSGTKSASERGSGMAGEGEASDLQAGNSVKLFFGNLAPGTAEVR